MNPALLAVFVILSGSTDELVYVWIAGVVRLIVDAESSILLNTEFCVRHRDGVNEPVLSS